MPITFDELIPNQPGPDNQSQETSAAARPGVLTFDDMQAAPAPPPQPSYTGQIMPFSKDEQGNVSFDSNAGLLGMLKNAVTAPGDAYAGNLQVMGPDGNVTPEAIQRGWSFANTVSPMTPGMRAGEGVLGGPTKYAKPDIPVPTQEELLAAGGQGYEALRHLPVDYTTSSVNDLAGKLQSELYERGLPPVIAPQTNSILSELQQNPAGSVASAGNLISARRSLGGAAQNFQNPSEQVAASHAISGLDQFLAGPPPAAVISGQADAVGPLLERANANYAAGKRSETLSDLQDAAQIRANAANSGANIGNSTRSRVGSLLLNDKAISGFSPEEIDALRGVNAGDFAANATRRLSNYLGGGGGLGGTIAAGAGSLPGMLMGSPEIAGAGAMAAPAVGHGLKELSNALTTRALNDVDRTVRMRSPLYQEAAANLPPSVPVLPMKATALLRAMMLRQPGDPQSNTAWINRGGT